MFQHHRHGASALQLPGTAKVHQLHTAVLQHHHIVGTDISVEDPRLMYGAHGGHHRPHQVQQLLRWDRSPVSNQFLQSFTLQKLHH